MTEQTSFVVCEDVPESALLRRERKDRYGGVPGLEDDELADPDELERQVVREELGPVMLLPGRQGGFRPDMEDGIVVGAFGSVDFDRCGPGIDKARHKAGKLREQLKDLLIMVSMVKERLPGKAKYLVLKYLRMGIIELEHVVSEDMVVLARMHGRARKMREEIAMLEEASVRRRQRQVKAVLG